MPHHCLISLLSLAAGSCLPLAATAFQPPCHRSLQREPVCSGGKIPWTIRFVQGWDDWGPGETRPPLSTSGQQRRSGGGGGKRDDQEDSMEWIEQEVMASAQARVDLDNVNRALQQALADDERIKAVNDQRAIAVAAGAVSGLLVFVLSHTLFLSGLAFAGVAFLASRDPTEEDSPAGAIARILGRATLSSAEKAAPKVKALARTALTGQDDVVQLREDLREMKLQNHKLKKEISQLRLWKHRKEWIDENGPSYNLQDLKDAARQRGMVVSGTKPQLLMRLIEADVIRVDF